jgi:hypothetical protein
VKLNSVFTISLYFSITPNAWCSDGRISFFSELVICLILFVCDKLLASWRELGRQANKPGSLLNHARPWHPLLEQGQALPVQPALEVAEQFVPLAGRRAIEFLLD